MALINANTIIRSVSLFHITLGFFFLTSPGTIADQTLVFIMGEAMGLPNTRAFDVQSAPLAFLGALLIIVGISDLVAVSMPEEIALHHWGTQAPIRLTLFFALTLYTFLGASSSSKSYSSTSTGGTTGWGDGLKNRVVFTWSFVELMTWFWAFGTVREERQKSAVRAAERKALREEAEGF